MSCSSDNHHKTPEVSKQYKIEDIFLKVYAKKRVLSLIYHRKNCLPGKWVTIKIIIKAERNEKRILIDLIKMDTLSFIHFTSHILFHPSLSTKKIFFWLLRRWWLWSIGLRANQSPLEHRKIMKISIYWINNFIICPLINVISHFHAYFNGHQRQYALHIYLFYICNWTYKVDRAPDTAEKNIELLWHIN